MLFYAFMMEWENSGFWTMRKIRNTVTRLETFVVLDQMISIPFTGIYFFLKDTTRLAIPFNCEFVLLIHAQAQ
jgi:hypothetical protein